MANCHLWTETGKFRAAPALAIRTRPDNTTWAFTHPSQRKTWYLQNHVDPIVKTQQSICRNSIVQDSPFRYEVSDFVIGDAAPPSPVSAAIDLHVDGDQDNLPRFSDRLG
jgi:hypothetical protein